MESFMKKLLLPLTFASVLAMPGPALATNGYFLPGYGAKAMGMGGAGVAFAQDAISAATNPAGLTQVGSRMDFGAALFKPMRRSAVWNSGSQCPVSQGGDCNVSFAGDSWSFNQLFLLPSMGFSFEFSDNLTLGFAMVGNGGMNSSYSDNFYNWQKPAGLGTASDTVGVDMSQVLIPITVAYKLNDTQNIAASLVLARQRFSARGLESFIDFGVSSDNEHLTNKGAEYSNGYGMRLGWLGKFAGDRLALGATWASRTYMNEFKKYEGLFAEHGDFDIPENWAFGLAFNVTPKLTVAFDYEQIFYHDIKSIGNRGPGLDDLPYTTADRLHLTGLEGGMGFGWTNQTVYKLGVNWQYDDKLTLRAGYNYGKSPIPNDQLTFNLLAPATVEDHYSVGFTYNLTDDTELTMAFTHAARNKQSGCGFAIIDCAEFEMYQNVLDVGFALKF